jgi:hypothetical protein
MASKDALNDAFNTVSDVLTWERLVATLEKDVLTMALVASKDALNDAFNTVRDELT